MFITKYTRCKSSNCAWWQCKRWVGFYKCISSFPYYIEIFLINALINLIKLDGIGMARIN